MFCFSFFSYTARIRLEESTISLSIMYVRIYQEQKAPNNSAPFKGRWILEFVPNHSSSYVSSTMHWNASNDTQRQIKLRFKTEKEATRYAKLHKMDIVGVSFNKRSKKRAGVRKNYLDNFQ